MDFQDYAARETSALLARAASEATETSRQRLQAFRSAINAATKALEGALTTSPQIDISDLTARLTKAAMAESEAAAQRVAAEAKSAAQRAAAEAKAATDALQAQLKAELKQKESLAAALEEARAQADELRLELQTDRDRIEQARQELSAARDAHKNLEAARADVAAERDKEARARAAAESELQKVRAAADGELQKVRAAVDTMRADADTLRAEADRATADAERMGAEAARAAKALEAAHAEKAKLEEALNSANSQAQAAEAKLNAVTSLFKASATRVKALERAALDHEDAVGDLEAKLSAARSLLDEQMATINDLEGRLSAAGSSEAALANRDTETVALLDDMLDGFQTLAAAKTIGEVLTSLVRALSREFARVALFRLKGNRLEGQEQIGFDSKTDIAKLVMPLGMDSLLTRAVNSGRIERMDGSELADTNHAPFGGSATCAVALPIVVNGETLAILYGDDSGRAEASGAEQDMRTRFADAMLRHGVALLMRLTTELRTLAELRAYASSLLTELEQMYESDVNAGKSGEDLQNRLKDNLEYARSIYSNRIALECPDAATLLEDQLAGLVEKQQGTPFGRDLGVVAEVQASGAAPRRAAEAS